jgi:MerR family mercuric resistance operon transcriptional regulator
MRRALVTIHVTGFPEHKRADIKARMADLARIEIALSTLIDHCRETDGTVVCPLIASLQGE